MQAGIARYPAKGVVRRWFYQLAVTLGPGNYVVPASKDAVSPSLLDNWGAEDYCGDTTYPGVYSRVTHQLAWIKRNIAGRTCKIPG